MPLGTGDQDVLLADFGEEIIVAGQPRTAIFDRPDSEFGSGAIIATDYSLLGKTSELGTAKFGDPVIVRGEEYSVKEVKKLDDGVFCRVSLSKDDEE